MCVGPSMSVCKSMCVCGSTCACEQLDNEQVRIHSGVFNVYLRAKGVATNDTMENFSQFSLLRSKQLVGWSSNIMLKTPRLKVFGSAHICYLTQGRDV